MRAVETSVGELIVPAKLTAKNLLPILTIFISMFTVPGVSYAAGEGEVCTVAIPGLGTVPKAGGCDREYLSCQTNDNGGDTGICQLKYTYPGGDFHPKNLRPGETYTAAETNADRTLVGRQRSQGNRCPTGEVLTGMRVAVGNQREEGDSKAIGAYGLICSRVDPQTRKIEATSTSLELRVALKHDLTAAVPLKCATGKSVIGFSGRGTHANWDLAQLGLICSDETRTPSAGRSGPPTLEQRCAKGTSAIGVAARSHLEYRKDRQNDTSVSYGFGGFRMLCSNFDLVVADSMDRAAKEKTAAENRANADRELAVGDFKLVKNAAIAGYNNQKLNDVSVLDCMNACAESSSGFVCKSFDYNKNNKSCDLSDKNAADFGGLKTDFQGNPFDHYEYLRAGLFKRTPKAAISGHNEKSYSDVSVRQCKNHCLDERSFACKSFDYNTKARKCDLSDKNEADVGELKKDYPGDPYDHYELIQAEKVSPPPSSMAQTANAYVVQILNMSKSREPASARNLWTENYIGNGKLEPTAQKLIFEHTEGEFFRIRVPNNLHLHIQHGWLDKGAVKAEWHSGQWKAIHAGDGYVQFQNREKPKQYLHTEKGKLEVGPIEPGWLSARWLVEKFE